jgi:hypothetical protein
VFLAIAFFVQFTFSMDGVGVFAYLLSGDFDRMA